MQFTMKYRHKFHGPKVSGVSDKSSCVTYVMCSRYDWVSI